jgi:hypothetical protein
VVFISQGKASSATDCGVTIGRKEGRGGGGGMQQKGGDGLCLGRRGMLLGLRGVAREGGWWSS